MLLQLSAWDPETGFQDWIVRRLTEDHGFLGDTTKYGSGAARELLVHRRLLPLLDGLDELPPEARGQVLRALRENTHLPTDTVLTCRTEEFHATTADEPLPDSRVVRLPPVAAEDTVTYPESRFPDDLERREPVLRSLRTDPTGPLATALSRPLMLFLTVPRTSPAPARRVRPAMPAAERALLTELGYVFQLLDDLHDLPLDRAEGITTSATLHAFSLADLATRIRHLRSRFRIHYGTAGPLAAHLALTLVGALLPPHRRPAHHNRPRLRTGSLPLLFSRAGNTP